MCLFHTATDAVLRVLVLQLEMWPILRNQFASRGKRISPSAVFTEIQTYILGSAESLESNDGGLSETQYLRLGRKHAPYFSHMREDMWRTYQRYRELAVEQHAWDVPQLVWHIYQQIKQYGWRGPTIHSCLIDEVQDFSCAELKLVMTLCDDTNRLVFCGDTAQTISRVGFRFEDLRTLFCSQAAEDACNGVPEAKRTVVPEISNLCTNFRSHDGILQAANAVVATGVDLFPDSFDRLSEERGAFGGPSPHLIGDTEMHMLSRFVRATMGVDTSVPIEFGANQCVIVRNAAAKAKLPHEFRECLVLTVAESKGLEFNDVVVINFFADGESTLGQWAAILKDDELDLKTSRTGSRRANSLSKPCTEDKSALMALCEDIKNLYVAVTRARRRVIVFDNCHEDKRVPAFEMLCRRHLGRMATVEDLTPSGEALDWNASQTSPWDWIVRGEELMEAGAHDEAAKCFRRGDDHRLELEAMARSKQRQAAETEEDDTLSGTSDETPGAAKAKRQLLFDAGYGFTLANKFADARRCFESIGEGLIVEKLRQLGGGQECKICMARDADCRLLPCTHEEFCVECVAQDFARQREQAGEPGRPLICPTCRQDVNSTMNLETGAVTPVAVEGEADSD